MRVLRSVLIVILAGAATVLLAIAGRAGLKTIGSEAANWTTVIAGMSMLVVVWTRALTLPGGLRPQRENRKHHHFYIPFFVFLIAMGCYVVFVNASEWLDRLSMTALFAVAMVTSLEWEKLDALCATETAEQSE